MTEKYNFKLIREIDPTKKKLPIDERFCKLTLSSNKKVTENAEGSRKEPVPLKKDNTVNRNLLESFSDTVNAPNLQDADIETNNTADGIVCLPVETELAEVEDGLLYRRGPVGDFDTLSQSFSSLKVLEKSLNLRISEEMATQSNKDEDITAAHYPIDISTSMEDDSEFCITVSDSSYEQRVNNKSRSTASPFLHTKSTIDPTFSVTKDEKCQRIEAYLRDVSAERCNQQIPTSATHPESTASTDESDEGELEMNASHVVSSIALGQADTCTMSTLRESDLIEIQRLHAIKRSEIKSLKQKREQSRNEDLARAYAQTDTETMSTLRDSDLQEIKNMKSIKEKETNIPMRLETSSNARRFIDDDTVANSFNDDEENQSGYTSTNDRTDIDESIHSSVTIPETDVSDSEQKRNINDNVPTSTMEAEQENIQANIEGISISAKINIKIQISTTGMGYSTITSNESEAVTATDRSSLQSENTEERVEQQRMQSMQLDNTPLHEQCECEDEHNNSNEQQSINQASEFGNNEPAQDEYNSMQTTQSESFTALKSEDDHVNSTSYDVVETQQNRQLCSLSEEENKKNEVHPSTEDEPLNCSFVEAEKLLNELYGDTWKTPDVIRKVKRNCVSTARKAINFQTPTGAKTSLLAHCFTLPSKSRSQQFNQKVGAESTLEKKEIDSSAKRAFGKPKSITETPKRAIPLQPKEAEQLDATERGKEVSQITVNDPGLCEESVLDFNAFKMSLKEKEVDSTRLPANPNNRETTEKGSKFSNGRPKRAATHVAEKRWRHIIDSDTESKSDEISDGDEFKEVHRSLTETSESDSNSDYEIPKVKPKSYKKSKENWISRSELNDEIIYLDLTKPEVEEQDPKFQEHNIQNVQQTSEHDEKSKLSSLVKPPRRRKLFTPNVGYEDEDAANVIVEKAISVNKSCLGDLENIYSPNTMVYKRVQEAKKQSDSDELTPNFKKPLGISKTTNSSSDSTPKSLRTAKKYLKIAEGSTTSYPIVGKYSFLKSLDPLVDKVLANPVALMYRENYNTKKEELTKELYNLYTSELFGENFDVEIIWNKKLQTTAGRCRNKKKGPTRNSVIELSDKVCTSADRLRCTLIHELCHAATWIFSGEGGHGFTWKSWASRANKAFPDLPKIGVCHQYEIEYKYTYKCSLCDAKSYSHSKSKKTENIRCALCHGAIEVFLNKKNRQGEIVQTPVNEPKGFAKFVKDNYKQHKHSNATHAEVMKSLSKEFAKLKTTKME